MGLGLTKTVSDLDSYIDKIMRGDNTLGLTRPKFLSDQIYNKILFRSVYPSPLHYDDRGVDASLGKYLGNLKSTAILSVDPLLNTQNSSLTYPISVNDEFKIHTRNFNPNTFTILENIGRLRFDTTIVRNLFFIVNILRVTRLKLNRELTASRNVVVNSHYAVNPSITEYGVDPFGPHEMYLSKTMDDQNKYNVLD